MSGRLGAVGGASVLLWLEDVRRRRRRNLLPTHSDRVMSVLSDASFDVLGVVWCHVEAWVSECLRPLLGAAAVVVTRELWCGGKDEVF